jgi:hypothetical protein
MRPSSLDEAAALAERMASNPADAVSLAGRLQELIRNLPPERSELVSRYRFDRSALWTLIASFENVAADLPETGPSIVTCQHDVWIRGVQAIGIWTIPDGAAGLTLSLELGQVAIRTPNGLPLFEANWRINGKQGFISNGNSEVLGPAALDAGDGFFSAPLDWRLQKDDTIEVRIRSRLADFMPTDLAQTPVPTLRWVVVAFWAEELRQPGLR